MARVKNNQVLTSAIKKARQFQEKAFAGRTFSVSSPTPTAQDRRERTLRKTHVVHGIQKSLEKLFKEGRFRSIYR